jgi:hypothetical protein
MGTVDTSTHGSDRLPPADPVTPKAGAKDRFPPPVPRRPTPKPYQPRAPLRSRND